MTKKDYIAIAKVFRSTLDTINLEPETHHLTEDCIIINTLIDGLCRYMASDNPLFNSDKFIRAIYPIK